MYCWGACNAGQLGITQFLKGRLNQSESLDVPVKFPDEQFSKNIIQVATGLEHTLFLTKHGRVYVSGCGEKGQLGIILPSNNKTVKTPVPVPGLSNYHIVSVAVGDEHSMALTAHGEVFAWGDNTFGQTGVDHDIGNNMVPFPTRVKGDLTNSVVTRLACGSHHSLALASDGSVFGWGLNRNGQLGVSSEDRIKKTPVCLKNLFCLPILHICCGGQMSACLSRNGYLITWGMNRHGQLGRSWPQNCEDPAISSCLPAAVQQLVEYSKPITYATAGANHVAALDSDGKLWTFGLGQYGQLGRDSDRYVSDTNSVSIPGTPIDLVGSRVTQVQCGNNHTVILTSSQVLSFGDNVCGQLGVCSSAQLSRTGRPTLVCQNWARRGSESGQSDVSCQTSSENDADCKMEVDEPVDVDGPSVFVKQIFSGGYANFLLTTTEPSECLDRTQVPALPRPPPVPLSLLQDLAEQQSGVFVMPAPGHVLNTKQSSDPEVLDASILPVHELIKEHLQYFYSLNPSHLVYDEFHRYTGSVLSSIACWNNSFIFASDHRDMDVHGINLLAAEEYISALSDTDSEEKQKSVSFWIAHAVSTLPDKSITSECLRAFILLPLCPQFTDSSDYKRFHVPFAKKFIGSDQRELLCRWLILLPIRVLKAIVIKFIAVVQHVMGKYPNMSGISEIPPSLTEIFKFLYLLHTINKKHKQKFCSETFHVEAIHSTVNLVEDFHKWLINSKKNASTDFRSGEFRVPDDSCLYFCDYFFMFTPKTKAAILRIDSVCEQRYAVHAMNALQLSSNISWAAFAQLFGALPEHKLQITVKRESIIEDTLEALQICASETERQLKLPLKVRFSGEDAQDEGGVKREFFLIVMRKLLSADYMMFIENPESRYVWFNEFSSLNVTNSHFALVGMLFGLAIYNHVIVHCPFPLAMYKKLLDEDVTFEDFEALDPVFGRSLRSLLDYEGNDVEEVFCLNFTISRPYFEESKVIELKENGENVSVTNDNRQEFVDFVVDYVMNKSISNQFEAFQSGLLTVCGKTIFKMFEPHELMETVIGFEIYEWEELKRYATYNGVFYENHETIQHFWSVFSELDLEQKKKFLLFLTGCDRVPIEGMQAIPITFEPVRDLQKLPVAHTCNLQLDLPLYQTKDRLKYKLLQAIQFCEGFGLV